MLRVRFRANPDDPRPINWPVRHPCWITGFAVNGAYSIVVSYADDEQYVLTNWPEATYVVVLEENCQYEFSSRFPKPDWFTQST